MESNKTFPAGPLPPGTRTPTSPIGGSWLGGIPPNTPLQVQNMSRGRGSRSQGRRRSKDSFVISMGHLTDCFQIHRTRDAPAPESTVQFIDKVADAKA